MKRVFERACVVGGAAEVARPRPPRGRATDAVLARLRSRGRRRDEGRKQKRQRKRESEANAADYGTPGGAAGSMLSGRTSTCAPARADPGYLEDQIAFGVTLLFGNVGAEASPPLRALFLKILQDLENKRETRDSRKRARRARSAGGIDGLGRRGVCGAGRVACGHTQDALTPRRGSRAKPLRYGAPGRGRHAAPGRRGRASLRRPRRPARRAAAGRGSSAHNAVTAMSHHHPPRTPLLTESPLRSRRVVGTTLRLPVRRFECLRGIIVLVIVSVEFLE